MKLVSTSSFRTIGRLAGALLAAAGLALSAGVYEAAAAPPTPTLRSLKVKPVAEGSEVAHWLDIAWTNAGPAPAGPHGLRMNIYQKGVRVYTSTYQGTPGVPLGESAAVRVAPWLGAPNVAFCVGLQAYLGADAAGDLSPESKHLCESPPKPDLQVTRVSGPTELFDGQTAVYEVALWNDGAPATGTAQVLLGFLGGVEAQEMVDTPAGFNCSRGAYGFICTGSLGGADDAIQTRIAVFKVRGHARAKGAGGVYGSANHDRALDERTVDNNLKLLNVTVK
jgi:hypothetical protein